ncbi:MAG: hypothetical protein V7L14_32960 [Nostoc sp.]|uniref:hypothetical protein n=1 Tax=Nostoc sp. TaxID=1180 RepID=UPI002FFBA0FE
MVKDLSGLEITSDSSAGVDAINSFVDQLLCVGNDAQVVLKAVEADPACAMPSLREASLSETRTRTPTAGVAIANAQIAAFYLFAGGSVALTQARLYLNVAKANLKKANDRQKLYVAAIEAWVNRDIAQAIAGNIPDTAGIS